MRGTPATEITIPWRVVMSMKTVFTYLNRWPWREDRAEEIDQAHDNSKVKQRFNLSCFQRLSLETISSAVRSDQAINRHRTRRHHQESALAQRAQSNG